METSEVMTTEDIDKLDSVIQLNPHQKTVEYTTVGKSEDNDLVSLDELYEKTGQENIEKILAGLESLLKYNKLTREQGLLLKVQGAESWLELPDRMNAIKGGEGFISNLLNGFVGIIRSIIKFIKGICVWIYRRIMSLFGFEKTKEEKAFLYRKDREAKKAVVTLYKKLGVDVDYEKLASDLKTVKPTKENIRSPNFNPTDVLLAGVGSKNSEGKDIVKEIPALIAEIDEFEKITALSLKNIELVDVRYKKISFELRNIIRNKEITKADIIDIPYQLKAISRDLLNPDSFIDVALKILERINGVKPNVGIGLKDKVRFVLKETLDQHNNIRVKYTNGVYNDLNEQVVKYYNDERPAYNVALGAKAMQKLSGILDEKDADIIASITQRLNNQVLTQAYTEFSESIKTYTSVIESTAKVVQQSKLILQNLVDSHTKLDKAITALLAKDADALLDKQLNLSTADYNELVGGDTPLFSFKSINTQFIEKHPGAKKGKVFGEIAQAYIKSPEGKTIKDAARTFATSFQRKR